MRFGNWLCALALGLGVSAGAAQAAVTEAPFLRALQQPKSH
jgi:hypothetical protein